MFFRKLKPLPSSPPSLPPTSRNRDISKEAKKRSGSLYSRPPPPCSLAPLLAQQTTCKAHARFGRLCFAPILKYNTFCFFYFLFLSRSEERDSTRSKLQTETPNRPRAWLARKLAPSAVCYVSIDMAAGDGNKTLFIQTVSTTCMKT